MITAGYTSAILFGLMAGFFYAFSVSVMPGLNQIDPSAAIEAMQGVNRAVQNPVFFITFFTPSLMAFGAGVAFWMNGASGAALLSAAAGGVYIAAAMAPTVMINVPINEELAALQIIDAEAEWADYTARWTLANHIRTVASLVSLTLANAALRLAP